MHFFEYAGQYEAAMRARTICFAVGIFLLMLLIVKAVRKGNCFIYGLWPAFLLFGAAAGLGQEARYAAVVPGRVIGNEVYGLIDSVAVKENGYAIVLKDCTILADKQEKKEPAILLYTSSTEELPLGSQIRVFGEIKAFERATNLGQFDMADYYAGMQEGGIFYSCYSDDLTVLQMEEGSLKSALYEVREKLAKGYREHLPPKEASILSAMLLGERNLLDADIKQRYEIAGISHILAISGLHISLLGTACLALLKKLSVPVLPAAVISIILITIYCILTGSGVSTVRASIMLIILLAAPAFGRTYDRLSAVSGAALWLLHSNPFLLYQAGFLMSFGAVFGISVLAPAVHELLHSRERTERIQKLLNGLIMPLCIQAVLLPIMMWFFYEISVYSVLVNLIVLPLSSYVVLSGTIGGVLGIVSVLPARFVLGTAWLVLQFFELICKIVQRLPGAVLITGQPGVWKIVIYYLTLAGFAALIPKLKKKSTLLLVFLGVLFLPGGRGKLALEFLNVGQGDGIVIRKEEHAIIVDCGSSSVDEVGTYRLIPMLKAEGIRDIELAIATHADSDHCSGLLELLEQSSQPDGVRVKALALSECAKESEGYQELKTSAGIYGIPVVYLKSGDLISAGELNLKCLHPAADYKGEDNEVSLVFLLSFGKFRVLLTGDLEGTGEEIVRKALEREEPIHLLKVAHHGSKYSSGEAFLTQTGARAAVISCGVENRYGHPHEETLKRLHEEGIQTYVTAWKGAIRVETDGETVRIRCRVPE